MRNKTLKYSLIGLIAVLVVVLGVVIFTGQKDEKIGTVAAVGGVCDGSEATTQLCNVNANYFTTQNNADVLGTFAVTGATTLTGQLSANGGAIVDGLYPTGDVTAVSTSSATYTLSASNICDSNEIAFTPLGGATTVTLPATSTLFASCLTAVGQSKDIVYTSVATGTVLAAGGGGTLGYTSSTTVAAGKYALLRLIRNATNTYLVFLVNVAN